MDRRVYGILISLALIFAMISVASAQFRDRFYGERDAGNLTERQERQQARIFEGVENHQISMGEFQSLEREQMDIEANRREAMDRGGLNDREFRVLMNRLDAASQHIENVRRNHR